MSASPLTSDRPDVGRLTQLSAIAGVAGVAACAVLGLIDNKGFFRAWLVAFNFVLGPTIGSLVVLMLNYLVGGNWGVVIRRPLEAATRTMPLVALFFVPVIFGIRNLYEWTDPQDEIVSKKVPYLNVPFFLIRAAIYFAVWNLLIYLLNRWSRRQDTAKSPAIQDRCATLSGPGILLYVLTITFASIDWVMSLEPHWYSTIFMAIFGMGQVLSGFVLAVAVVLLLPRKDSGPSSIPIQTMSDLGTLMLAFIMVWAYLSFCQFLLIWSGNIPVEVRYYALPANRLTGAWGNVAIGLAVMHFALPFFLLLNNTVKRHRYRLAALALWVLGMRVVEMVWMIVPSFHAHSSESEGFPFIEALLYPAALVGVCGIWLAYYSWQLQRWPLMPQYDPEASHHGEVAHH